MKPKKLKVKLSLGKEKIKAMDDSEMKDIEGGATAFCLFTRAGCITIRNCTWGCDQVTYGGNTCSYCYA